MATFEIGSIVKARGRDWVVLPESAREEDLLVLRPLGGGDDEVTGVYLPLEPVVPARFPPPDPRVDLGNHLSASLLRDAVRVSLRAGAGPFRSLGRIAVDPRPYQVVPLLMALRLDPVRLLLADDVGVGKTVEALLIARELFDRGEVSRLSILCPPHLAGQWLDALTAQFGLAATLVLASTASSLERDLGPGQSLFEHHPITVVSLDYIKSERRRETFLRAAPELIIVDEAHGCADDGASLRSSAQQRHRLLVDLSASAERHIVLVTATPHSGKQAAFRSLLGILDRAFLELPEDLSGKDNRSHREHLARHFIQRRRGDVERYLSEESGTTTTFPQRISAESTYQLDGTPYQVFFERVLAFCQERVAVPDSDVRRQRVRWWSALSLLRAVGSSPAAAVATLTSRARSDQAESPEQVEAVGRQTVLDLDDEALDGADVVHGTLEGEPTDATHEARKTRAALTELAKLAEDLQGARDPKLQLAIAELKKLLKQGVSPIVFCRFIDTAQYVAEQLKTAFGKKTTVIAVTGEDPPDVRRQLVLDLSTEPSRILVATDCLSEGINLQDAFDAVIHYDLSWNPTRHEQREGRVDRFGQTRPQVFALTLHGADNKIDRIVRKKLLEKHEAIKKQTGVSIPVPREGDTLVAELVGELLLKPTTAAARATQFALDLGGPKQLSFEETLSTTTDLDRAWQAAADREKVSRSLFAQHGLKADEVWSQVRAARDALGGEADLIRFVDLASRSLGAHTTQADGRLTVVFDGVPGPLAHLVPESKKLTFSTGGTDTRSASSSAERLVRAHPFVAALSDLVVAGALDASTPLRPARRGAVIRSSAVTSRTVVFLLRLRFRLITPRPARSPLKDTPRELLAEDVALIAVRQGQLVDAAGLLEATPEGNVPVDIARAQLERAISELDALTPSIEALVRERAQALAEAHEGVRSVGKKKAARSVEVEPTLPPDVLGAFVYLPLLGGASPTLRADGREELP